MDFLYLSTEDGFMLPPMMPIERVFVKEEINANTVLKCQEVLSIR